MREIGAACGKRNPKEGWTGNDYERGRRHTETRPAPSWLGDRKGKIQQNPPTQVKKKASCDKAFEETRDGKGGGKKRKPSKEQ